MASKVDTYFMAKALELAEKGRGTTSPNPMVGALVIKNRSIIGQGYHEKAGTDHAEIIALKQAGMDAAGATLYVTMEPCCHYGKTPPCTQAIIEAKVAEVYISTLDPNPLVSGKSIKALNEAGIRTYVGSCEKEARKINEAYIKYITTGRPFVIAKFAMSIDGKIATKTGNSKWISSDSCRKYVHMLRHCADMVMVGVNTIIKDDPRLTARGCNGKGGQTKQQPIRLVVDSKGKTPVDAQLFKQPGKTMLAVIKPFSSDNQFKYGKTGAEIIELSEEDGMVNLDEMMQVLGKKQVVTILTEGGSSLLGSLFDRKLVDKVLTFVAPIVIGGSRARTAIGGKGVNEIEEAFRLKNVEIHTFSNNVLMSGYVEKS